MAAAAAMQQRKFYKSESDRQKHLQELSSSVIDNNGVTFRFVLYDGISVSPFPGVLHRISDYVENFTSRPSDIWICAFVKSGTHWVNEMASMLLSKSLLRPPLKEDFMLERVDRAELEKLQYEPRLLNTHMWFRHLPHNLPATAKIIFVTRDVRDVAVSLYHHSSSREPDHLANYVTTFEAYLDLFCRGVLQNGDWFGYVKEWHEQWLSKRKPNTLILNYAEMKRNSRYELMRIARFLLTDAVADELPDQLIDGILEKTSFQSMKRDRNDDCTIRMYRNGENGDWRNWFSDADLEKFKATLFDNLSPEDKEIFLHYSGINDWNS